jgi:hypothetical protein
LSACRDTRKWMKEKVSNPVNKVAADGIKLCHNAKKKIEESFEKPVEEWVSQQERRCREMPWWNPLRWFCELVMIVVKVVTWLVVTVVKFVTVAVCHVVSHAIKVVAGVVTAVLGWLVGTLVCLFSEPKAVLTGLVDLWTAIVEVVDGVVDLVVVLLEDIGDLIVDIGHLVDAIGGMLGPLGVFIAGIVKWIINIAGSIVRIVRELVDNVRQVAVGILRLDWCRIAAGLTGIGLAVVQVVFLIPRIYLGWIGGIRDAFQEVALETTVEDALNAAFAGEPEALERARRKVRLGHRPFGLPMLVDARRFFISSRSKSIDLRELHRRGVIDLNSAVGTWSRCRGTSAFNWQRREVVYAGTLAKVDWTDVQAYLEDGPDAVAEFRVYAVPLLVIERDLRLAQEKALQLGVTLNWTLGDYEVTRADEVPQGDTTAANDAILERVGRHGRGDDMCHPPALAHFGYTNAGRNGIASELRLPNIIHPSGVTFRDRLPEWAFRWVLIHELGHYLGLDHQGHDGLEHIMFTNAKEEGLTLVTLSSVAEYALLSGESRFTGVDARVVWDWLPTNARGCLT